MVIVVGAQADGSPALKNNWLLTSPYCKPTARGGESASMGTVRLWSPPYLSGVPAIHAQHQ